MGELLQALILGIVQGATEFIPVSSSGHLVLVPWLLGWSHFGLAFDTTVHLGTLAGVLVYFRRDVLEISSSWLGGWRTLSWKDPAGHLGWLLLAATIPAGVIGLAFADWFESLFAQPNAVAGFLIVTGLVLSLSERLGTRRSDVVTLGVAAALFIGFAQAAAIAPGISRSGATIAAGLALGLTRASAARFSFLLSMPIIAAAGLMQLLMLAREGGMDESIPLLVAGFVTAGLTGYLCVKYLLAYLQKGTLYVFAAYCWTVATVSLIVWYVSGG